jgi:hypothetical protein
MEFLKNVSDTHVLVKDNYNNKRLNKNIPYEEVIHYKVYNEAMEKKRKLMFALRYRETEASRQYVLETRNGYCPHCHMLIPLNGICDCGYVVKK